MSGHYFLVILAFLIAQFFMASVNVYIYQKEKDVDYWTALTSYFKSEIGFFIVGFAAIFGIMFILSDFVDLSITRADLLSLEKLSLKQNLQLYFKTTAFFVGAFIQYIAFVFRKKGKQAIDKVADKL